MNFVTEVQKQFEFYIAHQDDLVKKSNGKFVVIVGEKVVADFEKEIDAYTFATTKYTPGTFMIQKVTPGDEGYSQTFSRVGIEG